MVAGGIAGMLLADFGADVVKVEQPGTGDPLRHWTSAGGALWWKVYARNKRFVTLNLKSAGRARAAAADAAAVRRAHGVVRARARSSASGSTGRPCGRAIRA